MSHWIAALTPEAREFVHKEIVPHGKLITGGDGANSHTIALFLIEEVVRLRAQIKDLQDGKPQA